MTNARPLACIIALSTGLVAGLASGTAQSAESAKRMTRVGTGSGLVFSDGGSFGAYQNGPGITVLDGTESRLGKRSVDLAGPCASTGGELQATGAGLFAIRCISASPEQQKTRRFMIYDPLNDTFTPSAGLAQIDGDFESITGVGRTWLAVQATTRGSVRNILLNWRTGQRIVAPTSSRTRILDLSSPSGTKPVCRGLADATSAPGFAYQNRRAIYQRRSSSRRSLYLKSCEGRSQRLATRGPGSFKSQLTSSHVSWAEQSFIVVRSLSSRRQTEWRAPGRPVISVGLVGRHAVVGVAGASSQVRVYSGALPKSR